MNRSGLGGTFARYWNVHLKLECSIDAGKVHSILELIAVNPRGGVGGKGNISHQYVDRGDVIITQ